MVSLDKTPVNQSVSLPKWLHELIQRRAKAHAAVRTFSGVLTDLLLESPSVAQHVGGDDGNTPPAVSDR